MIPTRSGSLDYLDRAATTAAMLIHAGADEAAGELLDDLLAAIDLELVARGNGAPERALFEDLLFAAQRARELVPVPVSEEKSPCPSVKRSIVQRRCGS